MYGWTFEQISSMTEQQQNFALESDDEDNSKSSDPNVISFQDQREYLAWAEANGKN